MANPSDKSTQLALPQSPFFPKTPIEMIESYIDEISDNLAELKNELEKLKLTIKNKGVFPRGRYAQLAKAIHDCNNNLQKSVEQLELEKVKAVSTTVPTPRLKPPLLTIKIDRFSLHKKDSSLEMSGIHITGDSIGIMNMMNAFAFVFMPTLYTQKETKLLKRKRDDELNDELNDKLNDELNDEEEK